MKVCSKCLKEKEITEFWVRKNRKSGVNSECKTCASIRRKNADKSQTNFTKREWYAKNKEKYLEYCAKYQKKNKEKVNSYHREWWKKKKEEYNERRKELYRLRSDEQKEKNREARRKYRKIYSQNNPIKERARIAIGYALKRKWIEKPLICSKCMEEKKLEAHHPNYEKPLEVIWVCKACHNQIHKEM